MTASLIRRTACEPPNTSRIRSPGRPPNVARASSGSTPAIERIGVPVT